MKAAKFLTAVACAGLLLAGCGGDNGSLEPPPATGTISGQVTNVVSGAALPGASVTTQPATSTVQSDAQGNYSIADVPAGSYTVTATKTGYSNGTANVTVTGGETSTANVALTSLPTTGTIGGRVTDAATDAALAGATVTTQPATSTVTTDAQGNYSIADVAPGSYTVSAAATGYNSNNADVVVTAGQTSTADLALSPEAAGDDFDGVWNGTTSQDEAISFTVQNGALTVFSLDWVISCATGSVTVTFTTPLPLTGNTFEFTATLVDPSLTIVFAASGTFNSNTTASGDVDIIPINNPACVVEQPTWTATKQ